MEVALGREGLALTASLLSPASSCRALCNMLFELSPALSLLVSGNWDCHQLSLVVRTAK